MEREYKVRVKEEQLAAREEELEEERKKEETKVKVRHWSACTHLKLPASLCELDARWVSSMDPESLALYNRLCFSRRMRRPKLPRGTR